MEASSAKGLVCPQALGRALAPALTPHNASLPESTQAAAAQALHFLCDLSDQESALVSPLQDVPAPSFAAECTALREGL